jgi:hypothetical protein
VFQRTHNKNAIYADADIPHLHISRILYVLSRQGLHSEVFHIRSHIFLYDRLIKHVSELVDPAAVLFDGVDMHISDLLTAGMFLCILDRQGFLVFLAVLGDVIQVARPEIVGLDQGFVILDIQIIRYLNECGKIDTGLLDRFLGLEGIPLQSLGFAGLHDIAALTLALRHHDRQKNIGIFFNFFLLGIFPDCIFVFENFFRKGALCPRFLPQESSAGNEKNNSKHCENCQNLLPPDCPGALCPHSGAAFPAFSLTLVFRPALQILIRIGSIIHI